MGSSVIFIHGSHTVDLIWARLDFIISIHVLSPRVARRVIDLLKSCTNNCRKTTSNIFGPESGL